MNHPAILLFSGGIDSTTTAAWALQHGYRPVLLTFDYGQRHRIEIERSVQVAAQFSDLEQLVFQVDLSQIGGSALTGNYPVPRKRKIDSSIPVTYVPGRNILFLTIAAAIGEVRGAFDVFFGANIIDYSGYPDCRPEFIRSMEETLNKGTRSGAEGHLFRIHAPLLKMTKAEIIRKGIELGVDYSNTHSCYDPGPTGAACAECDSCRIRLRAFEEAGVKDPVLYQARK